MKPSFGRVQLAPAQSDWLGLAVVGALTRTVADSALMLDVMAEVPPELSYVAAAAREPGRLRIAASRKIPPGLIARVTPDQRLAWDRMARLLAELGHDVVPRDPRYGSASLEITMTYLRAIHESHAALAEPWMAERASAQLAALGGRLVSERRRDALRARRPRTSERILSLWREFDVLLTPGLASTALPAEGAYGRSGLIAFNLAARFTPFTPAFNFTGQPAISIPAGIGVDGLPLSVQLVGRPGAEDVLYSLAAQIEAAQPWAHRHAPGSALPPA